MTDGAAPVLQLHDIAAVTTLPELGEVLRRLRRRHARRCRGPELTYRELSARTGWSVGLVAGYFGGRILPPTDRFDELLIQLGATPPERGALASARDRVHETRRRTREAGRPPSPAAEVPEPGHRMPDAPAEAEPGRRPVPRQLPSVAAHLAGRVAQLGELDRLLAAGDAGTGDAGTGDAGDHAPAGTAVVLSGTAGVGKTTLAVHWAHRVAARFPDGQLYVDLRGFDPGGDITDPGEAIRGFLDALGVAPERIPVTPDARAALYRTLLSGRRILVVLDNARDADQVRPLLPAVATVFVLVTSRNRLTSLVAAGAVPVPLDLMAAAEARALLVGRLGAGRVDAAATAVDRIVDACARLPLALSIAAARARQTGFPLAAIAAELTTEGGEEQRLDALDTGDTSSHIRAVFSWSYTALAPDVARLFRLICVHPGPDLALPAAASLAGATRPVTRRLLAQLVQANLVAEPVPGRFALHDLLRSYGIGLTAADPEDETDTALDRLFAYYLATATAAVEALHGPDPAAPPSGIDAPGADPGAWLAAERRCLEAVVAHAATRGRPAYAVRFSRVLFRHLVTGHAADALVIHGHAVDAARLTGDRAGLAHALRNLGTAHWQSGRPATGCDHLNQALTLFQRIGDRSGEAFTLSGLGTMEGRLGRGGQAVTHLERAVTLYRSLGHPDGEARAMGNLGLAEQRLGRPSATRRLMRALALFQQVGDRTGEAYLLCGLGDGKLRPGRLAEAAGDFETALGMFRDVGNRIGEGWALDGLGLVATRLGQPGRAAELHRRSLTLFEALGDRDGEAWALNGLGEAAQAAGDFSDALVHHRAARAAGCDSGTIDQQARAVLGLGRAHEALGEPATARRHYRQARTLYADLGYPDAAGVEVLLARFDKPPTPAVTPSRQV